MHAPLPCAPVSTYAPSLHWDCECNLPGQWEVTPTRATQASTIPTRILAELLASAFWVQHLVSKREQLRGNGVNDSRPGKIACNPTPYPRPARAGGVRGV